MRRTRGTGFLDAVVLVAVFAAAAAAAFPC
jgi:hypothetical protein